MQPLAPKSPGRKPKGRTARLVYLDKDVVEAIADFSDGPKDGSNAINKLIRRGIRIAGEEVQK